MHRQGFLLPQHLVVDQRLLGGKDSGLQIVLHQRSHLIGGIDCSQDQNWRGDPRLSQFHPSGRVATPNQVAPALMAEQLTATLPCP